MSTSPNNPNDTPENPNNTTEDPSDDKDGLGAGAIIAIVLGSLAILGGFCFYWFIIRKRL